jgi:NADH-quinone oxidoreductase subunit N
MNLLAFSVVLSLSRQGDMHVHLSDYAGLARKSPFAAAVLSLALISLAGIPLTGGFMGKFYLFSAAIQQGYIALAIIGVLNSVVSVFYYFRIMVYMYMKEPGEQALEPETVSWPVQAIMVLGAIGVLFLGVWPAPILELAARSSFALK